MLEMFGIFSITPRPGKILVLVEALSRISTNEAVINDVEVPYVDFSKVINGYDDDQIFGPSVQALNENFPSNTKERV